MSRDGARLRYYQSALEMLTARHFPKMYYFLVSVSVATWFRLGVDRETVYHTHQRPSNGRCVTRLFQVTQQGHWLGLFRPGSILRFVYVLAERYSELDKQSESSKICPETRKYNKS